MRVAQPAGVDAPHARDLVDERLHGVGGVAVVAEHKNIGVERVDRRVEQQHSADVVKGRHDARVRQQTRRLLCRTALRNRQCERPLPVETDRVYAVDDDLAGECFGHIGKQRTVPLPGHRHHDKISRTGGVEIGRTADVRTGGKAAEQLGGRRFGPLDGSRTDQNRVAGQRVTAGQTTPLVARAAEEGH